MTQAFNLSQLANNVNTLGQVDVTTGLVGTLPIANGGTGLTAPGASGNVLTSNGTAWVSSPSQGGFSGATINSPSASVLTLTNTSTQYQVVQSTNVANNIVILPDATTLSKEGYPVYVIENKTLNGSDLKIQNSAGTVVGTVSPGQVSAVSLIDNSTSAGIWNLGTGYAPISWNSGSTAYNATSGTTYYGIVGLSATSFVRISYGYTTTVNPNDTMTVYMQGCSIAGSTITFGTATSFVGAGGNGTATISNFNIKAIRLSNTAFVIKVGANNVSTDTQTNSTNNFRTCTVSGTTITIGSSSSGSIPIPTNNDFQVKSAGLNGTIARLSDTSFAVIYNNGTSTTVSYPYGYSGSLAAQIVTVSGTTQTVGTAVALGTSTYTQPISLVALSSTSLFVCYCQATAAGGVSGRTKMNVVSISGTVPTWGSSVTIESFDNNLIFSNINLVDSAISPSSAQAIFNTSYSVCEASISGTVPTLNSTPANRNITPLYLTTSAKAVSRSNTLSISTGGFIAYSLSSINNTTPFTVTPQTPLGAQPTTAYIGSTFDGQMLMLATAL